MSEMRLFDTDGNRLYLTQSKRKTFLDAARLERPEARTLAETLAYTGCRISEALKNKNKKGQVYFSSIEKKGQVYFIYIFYLPHFYC